MPESKPVILLSFANEKRVSSGYLASLVKEAELLGNYLRPYNVQSLCDVEMVDNASVEKIFNVIEAWTKSTDKEIHLFHYGGHAGEAALMLQVQAGETEEAQAVGIAQLLGKLPELKLVFLNACSTLAQVELLFAHGVKAVIATSVPVNDQMAVDFADRFYKNLSEGETVEESFNQAKAFVNTKNQPVQAPCDFRSIDFSVALGAEARMPWGLYFHPDHKEEVLNWKLPALKKDPNKIGIQEIYTCDRQIQSSTFSAQFNRRKKRGKIQSYLIHGAENQSSVGLFKRFVLKRIAPAYDGSYFEKVILQEEAATLEDTKLNALTAIFDALELDINKYDEEELNIKTLADSKLARGVKCVVLMFQVFSSGWKPFTENYLAWVVKSFCDESLLEEDDPDFILFTDIVYEQETSSGGGLLGRLFKKPPEEKIKTAVSKFQLVKPLPELHAVEKNHIMQWMSKLTSNFEEKKKLYATHFSEDTKLPMSRVEIELEKILRDFHQE